VKDAGLQTPECVLWDADQDVYLVSNINGDPTALDGNGFISKIGADGKVIELKWIDGSKKTSELNAPKGMVITGGILYVADLNTIRKFDHKTGKPKGKIAVKDAVFLNGLAVSPDGKSLYVSDSAVKINQGQFSGTDADAIYEIDLRKKSVKALIKDRTLHWPNGLWADDTGIWSVSLGRNELIHVNYKGEMGSVTKLPKGSLDGIVRLDDTSFLISSWEGSSVYRGVPGGEFTELINGVASPAAIGLDSKRRAVLIPVFMGNAVEVHALPPLPLLEAPTPPPAPSKAAAVGPAGPGSTPIPDPELPPPAPPAKAAPATPPPAAAPAPAVAPPAGAPAPAAAAPTPTPATPAPAAPPPPAPSGSKPARWQ
jgi:sugar lactone lactonase YvrE